MGLAKTLQKAYREAIRSHQRKAPIKSYLTNNLSAIEIFQWNPGDKLSTQVTPKGK